MYDEKSLQASRLSLVIPVFNEAPNILPLSRRIVKSLADLPVGSAEVIFVNDGSEDGTCLILQGLCHKNGVCRAIHLKCHHGQTAAIDAGFKAATGELIVTMDGDLQNDPDDITKLLNKLSPEVGCVIGYRKRRNDNWMRRWSSIVANKIRNWVLSETFRDSGCGLKLFRRNAVEPIQLYEGMHRFFPTLVKMQGWRVVEVPVRHYPRNAGQSKYNVRNRLFRTMIDLYAVRWMKLRGLRYQSMDFPEDEV